MEPLIIPCPICSKNHTYIIKEQSVAIQNAAFRSRGRLWAPSRSQPSDQPSVPVFAQCPVTWQQFVVSLNRAYLALHNLNPNKVCLALVIQPVTDK